MAKEGFGLEITELRLGLPGGRDGPARNQRKRVFSEVYGEVSSNMTTGNCDRKSSSGAPSKSQVVGWPPVCNHRKKNSFNEDPKAYVKVSMDGAPFLRKIDLGLQNDYSGLAFALEKLFGCFGIGKALKHAESSECVPIYEDRDGDWMLLGDVPWEMFIESCKRLRIMKKYEAKGLGFYCKGENHEDDQE